MSPRARVVNPIHDLLPTEVEGFSSLAELALDVRWSSNHAADEIWRQLDPELWELTHNPWGMLQTVSRDEIRRRAEDPGFREQVDALLHAKRRAAEAPAWYDLNHAGSKLSGVGYFSMEFMLSEALPIYSGGLGNVAGDQLKAATDLGVPVVGVGLLYHRGYFRQVIDQNGAQQALYPYNDPGQMPVSPVREANGEWLRIQLGFPGYRVWLRAWQVQIGRTTLYLLDSNDLANLPAHRGITAELYGGGAELRLQQEIILGIGGWRLLRTLGIQPDVCHLNEGHAAFAVLERAGSFMDDTGQPFDVSLAVTRAGNLFTTHTAVPAGFDFFEPALIEKYLSHYAEQRLRIGLQDLLAMGRRDPTNRSDSFNMAYLAIRGSGSINGVSRLHGEVSRRIFSPLFPRWPEGDVPVGHITNGIHVPSWDSAEADRFWSQACGTTRWLGTLDTVGEDIRRVPDARLWRLRDTARATLVDFARARLAREFALTGAATEQIEAARTLLDPKTLTLGFARRFASYKRPNLLLHDKARLLRLLTDSERPIQILLAGKAHPADWEGQALIAEWTSFIRGTAARQHAIFLSDYDMLLTQPLVQGVDVWLNTPRRPWEASGTSGMKVLVNGGLNVSELDGWWAEAYSPEVGWAIGDGQEHADTRQWDAVEAEALYDLLENEVIPAFYNRDEYGVPTTWVARMRESMARLTPRFSTNRVVREYVEQEYIPAAAAFHQRAAGDSARAKQIATGLRQIDQHWAEIQFGSVHVETAAGLHLFEIGIHLGTLGPGMVRVELYADGVGDGALHRQEMMPVQQIPDDENGFIYGASVSADRPAQDYTARILPRIDGAKIPLESAHIAWQR